MNNNPKGIFEFLIDLSGRQTSVTKLFSPELLVSIREHLGLGSTIVLCFDQENNFLSWTDEDGVRSESGSHPYVAFAQNDVVEHVVFFTSFKEKLTYFNSVPKIYLSTEIISPVDYDSSAYVRFIEEQFGAHYSATLAFGIYGYIQLLFFKSKEEGDFTREEIMELENLYVAIAGTYINFKRHEQARIMSVMKDAVIRSKENAYFITDEFRHVLMCNPQAASYLKELFDAGDGEVVDPEGEQTWIPFVFRGYEPENNGKDICIIRNYLFKIHEHQQCYDHGIIERYYLITISGDGSAIDDAAAADETPEGAAAAGFLESLTATECKVAALLEQGMTYRQVSEELFVSYHTVKKHVENIYSKLGIGSRYELYDLLRGGR